MEGNTKFDAPRPAVTNRLGKKRTDEMIQADGDTWQEYLAVSEKANKSISNGSKRGGLSSLFGKKNKNKSSKTSDSDTSSSNLIIRSYFQNRRTGRKVWDEPPSGASRIVPASEEMRRMAELQLGEIYVKTTPSNGIEDLYESNDSSKNNKDKKKKTFLGKGDSSGADKSSAGGPVSSGRRIRYKPDSSLNITRPASGGSRMLNDRQLQEAIERSMVETYGGSPGSSGAVAGNGESEDEILRRVLEQSRLEAMSSSKPRGKDCYYDDDRKPPARKTSTRRR
eukprot:CAMPEP_0116119326 /NCGR_PEP_ID=MMETSP0329-20121206/2576_1 /TAXON_ID=697910 /ORGANISM="Pseudo-nitzschia arenysensis, Strain B593" /LENGTH=280 /DNA_ID=CAMNT_0003613009 /DNA_START=61 /DNA_END=906 /DNA_ORIENTATION=+